MEEAVRAVVVQAVRCSAFNRKVGGWSPPRNVVIVSFSILIVCLFRAGFARIVFSLSFFSKSTAFVAFE